MTKHFGAILVAVFFSAWCLAVEAQQSPKLPKIGWLALRSPSRIASSPSGMELFWHEFGSMGYTRGKNVAFEYRSADNKLDRLPALAAELVHIKVELIIAAAIYEAQAAKQATGTIPIIFLSSSDAVKNGLVASLAHPGGNLTGFITSVTLLSGKRLELLKETIPTLSRIAVLRDRRSPIDQWKENQVAAKALGLQLHSMEVSSVDEFEKSFKEAVNAGCTALSVTTSGFLNSHLDRTVELAAKYRLPAIYPRKDFVASGGLMSYGTDQTEPYKRIAVLADKILKGAKPGDLPVEQPKKFEFVINLKTVNQMGLTIPPSVLARADRVIR